MQIICQTCLTAADLPPGADPHAYTWCDCCTIRGDDGKPHHHGRAAESCPGNGGIGHPGEPCPHRNPKVCIMVSRPVPAGDEGLTAAVTGNGVATAGGPVRPAGEDCPGGHCGVGVSGCTVCRPVMHMAVVGDLQPVPAGPLRTFGVS